MPRAARHRGAVVWESPRTTTFGQGGHHDPPCAASIEDRRGGARGCAHDRTHPSGGVVTATTVQRSTVDCQHRLSTVNRDGNHSFWKRPQGGGVSSLGTGHRRPVRARLFSFALSALPGLVQAGRLDLTQYPLVGVGSVWRQASAKVDAIRDAILRRDPAMPLHTFGHSIRRPDPLRPKCSPRTAWSLHPRPATPPPLPEHRHKACANYLDYTLKMARPRVRPPPKRPSPTPPIGGST